MFWKNDKGLKRQGIIFQSGWFYPANSRTAAGPLAFPSRLTCISPMELTVYILLCADGSYYVGSTKKPVETRVWEHNEGIYDGYTALRRPVVLVFTETFDRLTDGFARSSLPLVGRGRGGGLSSPFGLRRGCAAGGASLVSGAGCAPPPLPLPARGRETPSACQPMSLILRSAPLGAS
jgi:predicted GIY-YIG superfamily endonuclease